MLTVNQVFEILVKWVETKDWEQSLYSVVPKRKFQQGKGDLETNVDSNEIVDDHDAASENELEQQDLDGVVVENVQ